MGDEKNTVEIDGLKVLQLNGVLGVRANCTKITKSGEIKLCSFCCCSTSYSCFGNRQRPKATSSWKQNASCRRMRGHREKEMLQCILCVTSCVWIKCYSFLFIHQKCYFVGPLAFYYWKSFFASVMNTEIVPRKSQFLVYSFCSCAFFVHSASAMDWLC